MRLDSIISGLLNILIFLLPAVSEAADGGIRGMVTGSDGTPLAYASIYVKQTGTGAATDQSGAYEIALPPGNYEIYFQYLGYETHSVLVEVGATFQQLNVRLKVQVVELQTVIVHGNKEDPAYAVMRRAIAKARYHTQQVDSFSAKVYIKGKGKLMDYPWIAKKMLEKEGITKDRLYIQESVSEIHYQRPSIFREKVIAIYTQGNNNNTAPNEYVFGSLYEPEIAETISPLSPKAFSYYRFEYLGIFKDQKYEINKIRVIPRSKGDNVFDGIINIVEDVWSIHSVDLKTTKLGIQIQIGQIYNPIPDEGTKKSVAWLPVTQKFKVDGSVFGFSFTGQYLATIRDYKVYLNPTLKHEVAVLDQKTEPATKNIKAAELKKKVESGQPVTTKELNQVTKIYEQEQKKSVSEPSVVSDRTFLVDKQARKKDSLYWAALRPAQLDPEELRGYVKADSFAVIEKKREEGDSLKESKSKGFQVYDVFLGDQYKFGKQTSFSIRTPYAGFNTVEGLNLIYRLSFVKRWIKKDTLNPEVPPQVTRFEVMPVMRYAFERNVFNGFLRMDLRGKDYSIRLEGGKYIQQLNPENPIHHFVNTLTTLMLEQNYMKILEREFLDLSWRYKFSERFNIRSSVSWNNRHQLFNATNYTLIDRKGNGYSDNAPFNAEVFSTDFPTHQALLTSITLEASPWQQFRVRNGKRYRMEGAPLFSITYKKGIHGLLGSDVNFDLLEGSIRHTVPFGLRGKLNYKVTAGKFLNSKQMYFPDFKHFPGNRTFLITGDQLTGFRLLDYYRYSTQEQYLALGAHYHFRKFLLTRIPKLRMLGIQENIFFNYLTTPAASNYYEAGFGLDGILRVFRIEAAIAGRNDYHSGLGFRIGISGNLSVNFSD
jgi:hypothetical protein